MVFGKQSSAILIHERHFGESGRNPGQFRLPRHICSLPDGNLCISDTVNQRVQVVTPGGAFVDEIVKAPPPPASPPLEYDAADAPRSSRSRSTMRWCPPPVTDSPAVTNTAAT